MKAISQLHRSRPATWRSRAGGSAIVEALVALVLFSAGIVGLIGLQAKLVTAQSHGKFRADAAYLASELFGRMWVDVPNLSSYANASCSGYAKCNEWANKVAATLPNGAATVTVNTGIVTVTVTWSPPNAGTHTYSATTAIRM